MAQDPRVIPGSVGPDGADIVPYEDGFAQEAALGLRDKDPENSEEAEEAGPDSEALFWQNQIEAAIVARRRWFTEAEAAERMYFGPDEDPGKGGDATAKTKIPESVALTRSNIEVLKPLLYSETPQPVVARRYRGDGKPDPTALMCAEAGQRLSSYIVTTTKFDDVMAQARNDWLIPGRGWARALYAAEFQTVPATGPDGAPIVGPDGAPVTEKRKVSETVKPVAVNWRRFLTAPLHGWDSLPWIAIDIPMARSRVEKRFPEHAARFAYPQAGAVGQGRAIDDDTVQRSAILSDPQRSGDVARSPFDTATVWEIWDREEKRVLWWSPDCPGVILDKQDDPLGLEDFFPGPKPLIATTKGDSLLPRPDIRYYEARAEEIDAATKKIDSLVKVLSVSGLIPASMENEIKKLFEGKNQIIGVQAWTSLMQKGGTSGVIQWLPIEQIIKVVQALISMRDQNKAMLWEDSGISDVMRSAGDPSATATQSSLEGKYAGLRLKDRQRQIAVFARDLLRQLVEMAVELFDTATLAEICDLDLPMTEADRQGIAAQAQQMQAQYEAQVAAHQQIMVAVQAAQQAGQQIDTAQIPPEPTPPELPKVPETSWELVHERLRSDIKRKITITIETNSTVLADEDGDRAARIEFLQAFSGLVQQLLPMMAQGLVDMKTVKELLLFGVRGFSKARTLELMISALPDEAPKSEGQTEDTAITVAKIRAEAEKELEAMKEAHDLKLAGLDLAKHAAAMATDAGTPPQPPQQQGTM